MLKRLVTVVAVGTALWAHAADAQFGQQGAKLTGTGATGNAWQGSAVAVSADGNTAIVGGYLDNAGAGGAWIFTRSNGAWTQQGSKLVGTGPSGSSNQGWSVAISGDGNTAIIGGPADNSGAGAAWVFARSGGNWAAQGNKLVGSGASGSANQGWSVALSADGNTALVGGPADNSGTGAVWVFARSGTTWKQQGSKLVGLGTVAYSGQGSSVAISGDGTTAAIGGAQDNHGYGAVWVYTQSGGKWSQQGGKLVGSSPSTLLKVTGSASATAGFAQQGVPCYTFAWAVSPSNEGSITVRTPRTCANGYAPGTQISLLVSPVSGFAIAGWSGTGGTFSSVSTYNPTFTISGNASVSASLGAQASRCDALVVEASPAAAGAVTVATAKNCAAGYVEGSSILLEAEAAYGWTFAGWTSSGGVFADPTAPTTKFLIGGSATATANFIPTPTDCFPLAAAATPDGSGSVTVDTPQNCPGGYTYGTQVSLTAYPAAGWSLAGWTAGGGTLSNPGGLVTGAGQGLAVALSSDGNTLAFGGNVAGSTTGRVWVFTRSGTSWSQQGNPLAAGGDAGLAQQAWSVGLSGDGNTALVAEPGDNAGMGAAWVFQRAAGAWTLSGGKLVGTGAAGLAGQGYAAALSSDGTTALVGGPSDNGGAGAAWVFASGATAPCTFALSPASLGFSQPGGRGAFAVNLASGSGCPWVAVSNAPWITVSGSQTGTDSGTVTIGVSANAGTSRSGTVSVAGQTFTAFQAGSNCAYAIDPISAPFPGAGGSGSFNVTTPSDCPWNAVSEASWIHLTRGSGIGNGPATFTVDPNPAGPRAGTIAIEGLTFTVAQAPPAPTPSFTVAPASAVAGEVLAFTDASTGAPTSWSWDFGDGGSSTAQNPTHTYAAPGTYTVALTVANQTAQASASRSLSVAAGFARWVPVVSHVPGANGTQWRSDVGILNAGSAAATVQGKLHLAGGIVTKTVVIQPGDQAVAPDVVGYLGASGSGALEVLSDQPVLVTSRTYDATAQGTLGQEYASYAPSDGLAAGQSAWLPQLAQDAAYRTNISLTNAGSETASVTVALFDGLGTALAAYDVTLAPGEWAQQNRPFFGYAGQTALDNGYATVTVNSGAGIVATAAVIDNVTNDPTTVAMTPAAGAGTAWVPTVSHVHGAHGTQWRSDVALLNPGTVDASVQGRLYVEGAVVTKTAVVPAGTQLLAGDIVSWFGAVGSGALEIAFDQPLAVSSRTYDQLASGTVGQGYGALPVSAGLSAGQSGYLPQLAEDAAYRTNIALTNAGQTTAQATVALFDALGNQLASYDVMLAPGERAQENQPFLSKAGQTSLSAGYAKVTAVSGAGVIASASVIDNASSDPTTVAMLR